MPTDYLVSFEVKVSTHNNGSDEWTIALLDGKVSLGTIYTKRYEDGGEVYGYDFNGHIFKTLESAVGTMIHDFKDTVIDHFANA